jgi:hypothetical protein
MTELAVATEDLLYCSKEDARLYAVEALIISKARDIGFYDAYYGLISHNLSYWIEDHIKEIEGNTAADLLSLVRKTESFRFYLEREENNFMKILRDEVIPIGCALYQMFLGSNKEKALSEAKEILQYRSSNIEKIADLPKSAQHLSKRKLERLWAIYSEVLHYIWLSSLNQWRIVADVEPVSYNNSRECWGQIMSVFDAVSPTKKISVSEPIFLKFMTTKEFQDQLPEIPPSE